MSEDDAFDAQMMSEEDYVDVKKKPVKKRAKKVGKKAWSQVKGKKGLLQGIDNLPTDVLIDILSHLDFEDLFHLSRSIKIFRELLIDDHVHIKQLWEDAIDEAGLPELPKGLSPMRLGALLFHKHCARCGSKAKNVDWTFRLRLCTKCRKYIVPTSEEASKALLHIRLYKRYQHRPHVWDKDLEALEAKISRDALVDNSIESSTDREAAYIKARADYLEEHGRNQEEDKKFNTACRVYDSMQAHERKYQANDLKRSRQTYIRKELLEDGYILADIKPALEHTLAVKPQLLDGAKWERIKSSIVDVVEQNSRIRLEEEEFRHRQTRRRLIESQWDEMKKDFAEPVPTPGSLFGFEPVAQLVEGKPINILEVSDDRRSIIQGAIKEASAPIEQWTIDTKHALIELAEGEDESVFDTSIFQCGKCETLLVYSSVFSHKCLRGQARSFGGAAIYPRPRTGLRSRQTLGETEAMPFEVGMLRYDEAATTHAQTQMSRIVGEEGAGISHDELIALGKCFHTGTMPSVQQLGTWTQVVGSFKTFKHLVWNMVDDTQLEDLVKAKLRLTVRSTSNVCKCSGCNGLFIEHSRWYHTTAQCSSLQQGPQQGPIVFEVDEGAVQTEYERLVGNGRIEADVKVLRDARVEPSSYMSYGLW